MVQATAICPAKLSPRASPHSVRARMSRSFSVTGITFLQAKKSPHLAGFKLINDQILFNLLFMH
jgi:hypothetical protein